jgi:hypothetical protein
MSPRRISIVMDLEYVHNRDVFDVLTDLEHTLEIARRQSVGVASDHV